MMADKDSSGIGVKRISWACDSSTVAIVPSDSVRDPGLKNKVENDRVQHLMSSPGLHTCATGTHSHTPLHDMHT